jgi:hypothetical protein
MVEVELRGHCRMVRVRMIKTHHFQSALPSLSINLQVNLRGNKVTMFAVMFCDIIHCNGLSNDFFSTVGLSEENSTTFLRIGSPSVLFDGFEQ